MLPDAGRLRDITTLAAATMVFDLLALMVNRDTTFVGEEDLQAAAV